LCCFHDFEDTNKLAFAENTIKIAFSPPPDPEVQAKRATEKKALEEYYALHGGGDHH
jgi:hypothetical protein